MNQPSNNRQVWTPGQATAQIQGMFTNLFFNLVNDYAKTAPFGTHPSVIVDLSQATALEAMRRIGFNLELPKPEEPQKGLEMP